MTPPNDDAGLSGAEPITSTINARISAASAASVCSSREKASATPVAKAGHCAASGGPKIGPFSPAFNSLAKRAASSPSASTVSGATSNIGVWPTAAAIRRQRRAASSWRFAFKAKTSSKYVAKTDGACRCAMISESNRPKFTVFNTERRGRPIEDMREARRQLGPHPAVEIERQRVCVAEEKAPWIATAAKTLAKSPTAARAPSRRLNGNSSQFRHMSLQFPWVNVNVIFTRITTRARVGPPTGRRANVAAARQEKGRRPNEFGPGGLRFAI